tara:strand:+ start:541 stop:1107 length:567 start_codon:yes stop_codon:yes gene_type:complete
VELSNLNIKYGLCISLGANIDSKFGPPKESLIQVKPLIEAIVYSLIDKKDKKSLHKEYKKEIFNWSSLYETVPEGTNKIQPNFINCVLLVNCDLLCKPSIKVARDILKEFQNLERKFGRKRDLEQERWLPRCLDIDLLWWENLKINEDDLILPHPRIIYRNFVISPLAEVLSKSQNIKKIFDKGWSIN